MIAAMLIGGAAQAASVTCSTDGIKSTSGWDVLMDLGSVGNGSVIATNDFVQDYTALNTALGQDLSVLVSNRNSMPSYDAIRLTTFPGLSMRWTFMGYSSISGAGLAKPPVKTVISDNKGYFRVVNSFFNQPHESTTRRFQLQWRLELVVSDVKVYAGGTGDISREADLYNMTIFTAVSSQACAPTINGFMEPLQGPLRLPPLPKPPTPTCQFPLSSMYQTVPLDPIPAKVIAADGSPRANGMTAERTFNLLAQNCGKDTKFSIYLTDNNKPGSLKNYLSAQGPAANSVGIRLYVRGEDEPINYGPAPNGSETPIQPAAINEGPTDAGTNYIYPITAQYVRLPGVAANNVPTGDLSAAAVVTVVYP